MTNSYQDYCLLGEIHNFEEKSPNCNDRSAPTVVDIMMGTDALHTKYH